MARVIGKLTARGVEQARRRGLYSDGGGLYLQVAKGGSKSWTFRYRVEDGKTRELGLGPLHTVSLSEAREKAAARRRELLAFRHGETALDPLDKRRQAQQAARLDAARGITFKECAEKYIAAHAAGWRSGKSESQWKQSLADFVYPALGSLPVQGVDVGLVMKVLERIWTAKPVTAGRVRGRIEAVLDYATARGWRMGENPARWRGHLQSLLPAINKVHKVEHFAALPYAEIGAFVAALREKGGVAAAALQLCILTASRPDEVASAKWDEFDLAARVWTKPPERTKTDRGHRVPLTAAAMGIVEQMAELRQGDYVFPGAKRGQPVTTATLLREAQRMGHTVTSHGFRATFKTWATERTNFPREAIEIALGHTVGGAVEQAYQRGDLFDKRRQLADAWARFCAEPQAAATADVVVPLRAG